MKALVVFHTPATPGRSVVQNEAQGMDLAKLGVSKDADSQLCWHILGMLVLLTLPRPIWSSRPIRLI